jgi:Skp family chaperone for outer membrane proteins
MTPLWHRRLDAGVPFSHLGGMKALLSALLLLPGLTVCHAADFKVATLDVQRVMSEYHKSQDAVKLLQQKEVSFAKELESLRLEGRKMVEDAEELRRLSLEPVLSVAERDRKKQGLDQKLADLHDFDVRYERARSERAAGLQAQAEILHRRVLEDVLVTTRAVGESEGFNLILNASRIHPESSEVFFSKNVTDLTGKVLAKLNATKP